MFSHRTSWVVGYPVLQEFFWVPGSHTIPLLLHGPDSAAKRGSPGPCLLVRCACLRRHASLIMPFLSSFDLLGSEQTP